MTRNFELEADGGGRAQSLHERMFSERANLDIAKLGIEEQRTLAQVSSTIERNQLASMRYQDAIKRNISAAAGMEKLAAIDRSSPNFDKQVAGIVSQYPEALGSSAFLKAMEDARGDRQLYMKAEAARSTATFNNPVVAKAYQAGIDQYGDPKLAEAYAKSVEESYNKAKGLATNADLSDQDRASALQILRSGNLTDQGALGTLQELDLKAGSIKAQRDASTANLKPVAALSTALTHLENLSDTDKSPELKAAREAAQGALVKYTGLLKTQPTSTADTALDNYLGKAGTPAVTPEQSAGNPAEATAAPAAAAPTQTPEEQADATDAAEEAAPTE